MTVRLVAALAAAVVLGTLYAGLAIGIALLLKPALDFPVVTALATGAALFVISLVVKTGTKWLFRRYDDSGPGLAIMEAGEPFDNLMLACGGAVLASLVLDLPSLFQAGTLLAGMVFGFAAHRRQMRVMKANETSQ